MVLPSHSGTGRPRTQQADRPVMIVPINPAKSACGSQCRHIQFNCCFQANPLIDHHGRPHSGRCPPKTPRSPEPNHAKIAPPPLHRITPIRRTLEDVLGKYRNRRRRRALKSARIPSHRVEPRASEGPFSPSPLRQRARRRKLRLGNFPAESQKHACKSFRL